MRTFSFRGRADSIVDGIVDGYDGVSPWILGEGEVIRAGKFEDAAKFPIPWKLDSREFFYVRRKIEIRFYF